MKRKRRRKTNKHFFDGFSASLEDVSSSFEDTSVKEGESRQIVTCSLPLESGLTLAGFKSAMMLCCHDVLNLEGQSSTVRSLIGLSVACPGKLGTFSSFFCSSVKRTALLRSEGRRSFSIVSDCFAASLSVR